MKPESQIAILKTVVAWQADEIEALQKYVEKLKQERDDELTGNIDGWPGELRVQFLTPQEHAWAKLQRAGKATRTVEPTWGAGGIDES